MAITKIKSSNITDDSITAAKIADGTVVAAEIASNAVTTVKIIDDAVTTAKIAADAITAAKIADVNVTTGKLADNAVTLAKMAGGTDGQILTYDASGDPVAGGPGTDGQVLTSTGAGSPPAFETISAGLTLATKQATTSGSSVTFSGITSGTSLIFVNFDGVSLSGSSDNLLIRLGDAGGIETSGYISTSTKIISGAHPSADTSSAGFLIRLIDDGLVTSGQMILTLFDAATFTWVQSHTVLGSIYQPMIGGGKKALSAELTQLSLLTTGSDTFDAGSINISYQ